MSVIEQQREWAVDWEVEVEVTFTATITVGRSEIIEADTAEEAAQLAEAEADVTTDDIDMNSLDQAAFELGEPENFKLLGKVTEWRR
jgi:hypothetical protein